MSIETLNLCFRYGTGTAFEKVALKNINLQINEGDFFGIIGHTGSGKSTLIQHFNALTIPKKGNGDVLVLGKNTRDKTTNLKELRSQVGMVFQYPEYQLFAETVFDDVAFGLKNFFGGNNKKKNANKNDNSSFFNSDFELTNEQIEKAVKQAITLVGLDYDKIKNRSPFELSGGQKRRVAIAGVIVTKPKILVFDEVAAGLDPVGRREILQLIHSLKKNCSPTIVMISHDMNEVARNCNRIAVLQNGEVERVASPSELFSDKRVLENFKLDLPETVKIALALREKGFPVRLNLFTPEELAHEIIRFLKDKNNGK